MQTWFYVVAMGCVLGVAATILVLVGLAPVSR
jgi:hypothetical protein